MVVSSASPRPGRYKQFVYEDGDLRVRLRGRSVVENPPKSSKIEKVYKNLSSEKIFPDGKFFQNFVTNPKKFIPFISATLELQRMLLRQPTRVNIPLVDLHRKSSKITQNPKKFSKVSAPKKYFPIIFFSEILSSTQKSA